MDFYKDTKDIQSNASQVELNNKVREKVTNGVAGQEVEIFSNAMFGKDNSKYGKKVDDVVNAVKMLSDAASKGDAKAQVEVNSITTVALSQPLTQRLNLLNFMGNQRTIGYNEALEVEYYQLQASDLSRLQASSGAVTFPSVKKRTKGVDTRNASAGLAIDYRELASGALDGMAYASEQVLTSITNQVVAAHIEALKSGIQNATTLKNYAQGITQANVDKVRTKARRFGRVTIMGDIEAVEKLNDYTGFVVNSATATEVRYPEAVMEEILRTGLISTYKNCSVVEMPNAYDLTKLNAAGDFYGLEIQPTDLWFVPQGIVTPLMMVNRGGLTSMTGNDLNTRSEITVFDLEFGNYVVPELIPFLGNIHDPSLAN